MMDKIDIIRSFISRRVRKQPAYPKNLHIEIVNQCDFNCRYCFSKICPETTFRKGLPPYQFPETVTSILRNAWDFGCTTVAFGGLGEPSLHPDYYNFLSTAKAIGYSVSCTTNGWGLDTTKISVLDKRDVVRVSVDTMHMDGSPDPSGYLARMNELFRMRERAFKMVAVSHGEISSELKAMLEENAADVVQYPLIKDSGSFPCGTDFASFIRCIYPWNAISVGLDMEVYPCPCLKTASLGRIDENNSMKDI